MIPARPSLITKQVAEGFVVPVLLAGTTSVWRVTLPYKPQEEAASRSACRILPLLYTAPIVLRKAGPTLRSAPTRGGRW